MNNTMDEKYDLKWKTYPDHLVGVFKELGEKGHFADVTLVSDDQVQTKAHKVVLSACSPVLKTLLVNNPHPHPLLYLRGIKQTELQAILKFMYFGETQIFEQRINDFVTVAKDLEVKEISEEQNEDDVAEAPEEPVLTEFEGERQDTNTAPDFEEQIIVKKDIEEPKSLNQERRVSRPRQQNVVNKDGKFPCDQCNYVAGQSGHLNLHRRSKHEGVKYPCNECDYKATTPSHLTTHTNAKHAGVRYPCDQCDYKATTQGHLTTHMRRKHE